MKAFDDKAPTPSNTAPEQLTGVAIGGDGVNRCRCFVGPKDLDILKKVNPKLEQVVDFGWFAFLAKPLFLIVQLGQRHVRPQLRLGHRAGHRRHQLRCCSR